MGVPITIRTVRGTLAAAAVLAAVPAEASAQSCVERSRVEAIIDDSGSMSSSDPQALRRSGLELFIRTRENATRTLGAVEFGRTAGTVFAPGSIGAGGGAMIAALRRSIRDDGVGGTGSGSTNYNEGFVRAYFDNPGADARIFLTDGGHNRGEYQGVHVPGPPTYVVGLGIGQPSPGDDEASRLAQIAAETGGAYFPNVGGVQIQSVFNTISAAIGCRAAPAATTLKPFSRTGQERDHRYRPRTGSRAVSLVLNWTNQRNRFRVLDVIALDRRGRRLASVRGLGGGRRLAYGRFGGGTFDSLTVGRVKGQRRLLIEILARRLRNFEAPLLQAGDLRSLRGLNLRRPARRRSVIGHWPRRGGWTVVLASQRKKKHAAAVARRALRRGLPAVGLLYSSRHRGLNRRYWVAFTGARLSRSNAIQRRRKARASGFGDAYVRYVGRRR